MILKGAVAQVQTINRFKGFRYWRINVTHTFGSGGADAPSMSEVAFKSNLVSENLAVGGVASASSEYATAYRAAMAFDGNLSTFWSANRTTAAWLAYDFIDKVKVNVVEIRSRGDGSSLSQAPRNFIIQSSADGLLWNDEWAVTDEPPWGAGETRTFNRPTGTP